MVLAPQARPPASPTLNEIFEAERGLVGPILAEPVVYGRISAILTGEDWTQTLHRGVLEVAGRLVADGRPIVPDAVLPHVGDVAPGGGPADLHLAALAATAPAPGRAEPLAHRIAEAARARGVNDHLDRDLYAWAYEQAQAQALRRGQFSKLDALGLAEEIEDVGGEIYNRMESALRVTLMHLLKWDRQPDTRTRSWHLSIRNGRLDIEDLVERHPSFRLRLPGAVAKAYRRARIDAAGETGLDDDAFPAECPYGFGEIMTRPLPWPPEDARS